MGLRSLPIRSFKEVQQPPWFFTIQSLATTRSATDFRCLERERAWACSLPPLSQKHFGNVVVNNDLTDNGLPGVAMHAHSPGALLSDKMIVGNRISGNGADTEDTATSGPTGVNVSGGDDGTGIPVAVITGRSLPAT